MLGALVLGGGVCAHATSIYSHPGPRMDPRIQFHYAVLWFVFAFACFSCRAVSAAGTASLENELRECYISQ